MKAEDFFWLVGLLEGEGSFGTERNNQIDTSYYPRVSVQMTDLDVIERVHKLLKSREKVLISKHPYEGSKTLFQARVRGEQAAIWMRILRPWMGERRKAQIDSALGAWSDWNANRGLRMERSSRSKLKIAEVIEIRRLYGTGTVSHRLLARMFRIGKSTVGMIVRGKLWSYV